MANSLKPTALLLEVWHTMFDGQSAEDLERACTAAMSECKFFPAPAEIQERIVKKAAVEVSDRCLVEWEAILEYCTHGWHPDVGWSGSAPALSAQGEYALRYVGGWLALAKTAWDDRNALVFRKKEFEAGYGRFSEMKATGYTPISQADARELLGMAKKVRLISEKKE